MINHSGKEHLKKKGWEVVCFLLPASLVSSVSPASACRGNAHSCACPRRSVRGRESLCGPSSPVQPLPARPASSSGGEALDPQRAHPPRCPRLPAPLPCPMPVPGVLLAADSKSVTWTWGSCVAQVVSFLPLTVPVVLQPLRGLPRHLLLALAQSPRGPLAGPAGPASFSLCWEGPTGREEAGSRLRPPRPRAASASRPLLTSCSPSLASQGPSSDPSWSGSWLLPLPQSALLSLHHIPIAGPVPLMSG